MRALLRWKDWSYSKMPPFFTAGFLFLLANKLPAAQSLARFAAWLFFCAAYLAFGYGVNDFADRDDDRRAGKPNAMLALRPVAGLAWLLMLFASSIAVLTPYLIDSRLVLTLASCYVVGIAYSVRPLRLKERGVAGLLAGAMAQRSLPVLVGAALFGRFDIGLWLYCVVFTLAGVRWLLLHQLIDAEHDRATGVETFVTGSGVERSLFLMKRVVFPLELAALVAWLISIALPFPVLWLLAPTYVVLLRLLGSLWERRWPPSHWTKYWFHPLSGFYEVLSPFFIGIMTSVLNPVATVFLLCLAALLAPREVPRLSLIGRLLKKTYRRGKLAPETSKGALA